MDGLVPTDAHSIILTRTQKIRERMMIETMSGTPAADKNVFLSLCLRYEQDFAASRITASDIAEWRLWDDDAWSDWFKLGTIE